VGFATGFGLSSSYLICNPLEKYGKYLLAEIIIGGIWENMMDVCKEVLGLFDPYCKQKGIFFKFVIFQARYYGHFPGE
jgi:hypothetical protein